MIRASAASAVWNPYALRIMVLTLLLMVIWSPLSEHSTGPCRPRHANLLPLRRATPALIRGKRWNHIQPWSQNQPKRERSPSAPIFEVLSLLVNIQPVFSGLYIYFWPFVLLPSCSHVDSGYLHGCFVLKQTLLRERLKKTSAGNFCRRIQRS